MGYAANLGFRASICTPFYFYDLEIENTTILKINPFAVMDATCNYYLKLTPNQSLAEIKAIINQVKSVDGHFISFGIMKLGVIIKRMERLAQSL